MHIYLQLIDRIVCFLMALGTFATSAHWTVLSLDYCFPPEQTLSLLPCCNSDEWSVRNGYHLDSCGIPLMPGWRGRHTFSNRFLVILKRPLTGGVNRMHEDFFFHFNNFILLSISVSQDVKFPTRICNQNCIISSPLISFSRSLSLSNKHCIIQY